MPQTLILVKPDAFERALTGEVLARFERKGLRISALKKVTATEEIAHEHYAEHKEKPFFGELVDFITGGPLVAAVLEGPEAVKAARQLIGATDRLDQLTAVSVPTLVIVGEHDLPFVPASRAMAAAIPGARLVEVANAGHSPQREAPDAWWRALSEFLNGS